MNTCLPAGLDTCCSACTCRGGGGTGDTQQQQQHAGHAVCCSHNGRTKHECWGAVRAISAINVCTSVGHCGGRRTWARCVEILAWSLLEDHMHAAGRASKDLSPPYAVRMRIAHGFIPHGSLAMQGCAVPHTSLLYPCNHTLPCRLMAGPHARGSPSKTTTSTQSKTYTLRQFNISPCRLLAGSVLFVALPQGPPGPAAGGWRLRCSGSSLAHGSVCAAWGAAVERTQPAAGALGSRLG